MEKDASRWTVANLQGQGTREAQQDAFGMSQLDDQDNGLYLILSDGMGGIEDGGLIAQTSVQAMAETFEGEPDDFDRIPDAIRTLSRDIYGRYGERGGATLIACHIKDGEMRFTSVGDSFFWLLRDGVITLLNRRHTWRNALFDKVLDGKLSMRQALEDEQGNALASFIGATDTAIDQTHIPIAIHPGDVLMLCSDGVTDALPADSIVKCMMLQPQNCCEKLQALIETAARTDQDNYTAIVAAYS